MEYLGDCINKNVWDYAGRKKSTIYISQLTALRTKFNKRIQEVRRADIICKVFHYHRYFSLPIPAWIWGEAIKLLPVKQGEDTNYDLLELDFWTRVKLFFSGYFKQAFSPTNMHIKADSLIQQKYSSFSSQLPNTVDSSLNLSRCPGAV